VSVSELFAKDCAAKISENVQLAVRKLSDPASLVNYKVSGLLSEAAKGNMGGLGEYAKSYLTNNTEVLVLAAAREAGKDKAILGNMNLVFGLMAQAVAAYNDLVMVMMKDVARKTVKLLKSKQEYNRKVLEHLLRLRDVLAHMSKGDPVFQKYLSQLREALIELDIGRREIVSVRNTLDVSDRFLSKTYRTGKERIQRAREKVQPLKDNKYLEVTDTGLARNLGLPTDKEQIHNIKIVPAISRELITTLTAGFGQTVQANAGIEFFYSALGSIQKGMPGFIKRYVLSLFDKMLVNLKDVIGSMSGTLNGSESAVSWDGAYQPSPLKTSVLAYKWAMDLSLVAEQLNLIPSGIVIVPPPVSSKSGGISGNLLGSTSESPLPQQGGAFFAAPLGDVLVAPTQEMFKAVTVGNEVNIVSPATVKGTYRVKEVLSGRQLRLNRQVNRSPAPLDGVSFTVVGDALGSLYNTRSAADKYEQTCNYLKGLNTIKSGTAILTANQAKEEVSQFEAQLLGFLVEVNASFASKPIRKEALLLCNSFISRTNLSLARDSDIIASLESFINTPLPLEDELEAILNSFHRLMRRLGFDRAADLLETGDFTSFFDLNGRNASYVGAALVAVSALKSCFTTDKQQEEITSVQRQLERREDLLNVGISIDFDMAILENLDACVNLTSLSNLFSAKESACGLLKGSSVGKSLQPLLDKLSF
jgi:hypothetical protein